MVSETIEVSYLELRQYPVLYGETRLFVKSHTKTVALERKPWAPTGNADTVRELSRRVYKEEENFQRQDASRLDYSPFGGLSRRSVAPGESSRRLLLRQTGS